MALPKESDWRRIMLSCNNSARECRSPLAEGPKQFEEKEDPCLEVPSWETKLEDQGEDLDDSSPRKLLLFKIFSGPGRVGCHSFGEQCTLREDDPLDCGGGGGKKPSVAARLA